jgi:hypothetical protein
MRTLVFASLVLSTLATGCASLTPVRTSDEAAEVARVYMKGRDRNLFKLDVVNESNDVLVVDREAVTLEHGGKVEHRLPGGVSSTYVIAPHGHHDLFVKMPLGGIARGESVFLNLDNVVLRDGQPVELEPVELRAN